MDNKDTKTRRYCFTIHNYTKKDLKKFILLAESLENHRFICFGLEKAPDTGTEHIQGYIELNSSQRFTYLHNYFSFTKKGQILKFHIEPAKGSAEQNVKYTKKDGQYFEFGEPIKQGDRNDLNIIKEAIIDDPRNLKGVIHEYGNNYQQLRYAEALPKYYLPNRDPKNPPKVFWLYGPTGVGKTKLVFDTFSDICSVSTFKWLGTDYNQNECYLLDDFREDDLPFHTILKITDRYPFTLEFKGSQIPLNSPYIVITSPKSIKETFRTNEDIAQLKRRVTEIHISNQIEADNINLRDLDSKYINGGVNDYKKYW